MTSAAGSVEHSKHCENEAKSIMERGTRADSMPGTPPLPKGSIVEKSTDSDFLTILMALFTATSAHCGISTAGAGGLPVVLCSIANISSAFAFFGIAAVASSLTYVGTEFVAPSLSSTTKDHRDETTVCVVCMEAERDSVFLPCMHYAACIACGTQLSDCPICRSTITGCSRIYCS